MDYKHEGLLEAATVLINTTRRATTYEDGLEAVEATRLVGVVDALVAEAGVAALVLGHACQLEVPAARLRHDFLDAARRQPHRAQLLRQVRRAQRLVGAPKRLVLLPRQQRTLSTRCQLLQCYYYTHIQAT
jgi:hypothetical protein